MATREENIDALKRALLRLPTAVKLSDAVDSTSSVEGGVAATPLSVKTAYDKAIEALTEATAKAPISHASSATTHGIGTGSNYGHVKLSDSTSSTSAASAGIAASPKAVKAAYDRGTAGVTAAANAQTAANTAATNSVTSVTLDSKTLTVTKGDGTSQTYTTVDTNTNNAVTQTVTTTSAEYPILTKVNATATTETKGARFASAVTLNPSTNTITATTFKGALSGNASTASKAAQLTTARTIDGVSFNGSSNITHYGECSTAAATAAKVVACTGFTLATGARITVRFTATNTAASPTLNVNSTGAKAIQYRNAAITAGYLAANRVYEFVYDGAAYELIGDVNTDTNTKVTQTITTTNAEYALLAMADAAATANKTAGTRFAKAVTLNPSTGTISATKLKSGGSQVVTSVNGVSADAAGNVDIASLASGWGMPSTRRTALTIGASDTEYTAPANGWFRAEVECGGGTFMALYNKTSSLISYYFNVGSSSGYATHYAFVPARKGDKVAIRYSVSIGAEDTMHFIYAEGEE